MRTIDRLLARTLAAGVLACVFAGGAWAVPIAPGSELSINGNNSFSDSPPQLTFIGLGNVGGTSGSFDTLPLCSNCVSFQQNLTANSTGPLWTVADSGKSSTFSISNIVSATFDGTPQLPNATVFANGTLTLTGFDATPGEIEVTTQGPHNVDVTFSATAIPTGGPPSVPEPTTLALLGVGMASLSMGMVLMRGKRQR